MLLSLAAWFLLAAMIGLVAGAMIQQSYGLWEIPLSQVSLLVPVVISLGLFPWLATGFLLAATIWGLLVQRLPRLEIDRRMYGVSLTLYASALGAVAWLALPLEEPFATYGALLYAACFLLPRVLSNRLPPGIFAG